MTHMRRKQFFLGTVPDEVRFAGRRRIGSRGRLQVAYIPTINMQHRMRNAEAMWWSQLKGQITRSAATHCTEHVLQKNSMFLSRSYALSF